jgi:hypothetical protein
MFLSRDMYGPGMAAAAVDEAGLVPDTGQVPDQTPEIG